MYPLTSCHLLSDAMDIKQRLLYSYTVYSIQHSAGAFVTGGISISPAHPHTIHSSIYELNTFYLQEKHTAYKTKKTTAKLQHIKFRTFGEICAARNLFGKIQ